MQVDFFERAKRVEEIPLLEKKFLEDQVQKKEIWLQQEQERVCEHRSNDSWNPKIVY